MTQETSTILRVQRCNTSASSQLHNCSRSWDTPEITAWFQHALWQHPALPQQIDTGSTLSPFPPPAGTELGNSPLWVCNIPIRDGMYLGQHLSIPACRYTGQTSLSVFDPAGHPHLHTDVPIDTDLRMLHPETGQSELLQPGRAKHAPVFPSHLLSPLKPARQQYRGLSLLLRCEERSTPGKKAQQVLILHPKSSPAGELTVCRGSTPSQTRSAAPPGMAGCTLLLLCPLHYLAATEKEREDDPPFQYSKLIFAF